MDAANTGTSSANHVVGITGKRKNERKIKNVYGKILGIGIIDETVEWKTYNVVTNY